MVIASKRRHYFNETLDPISKARNVYYKLINNLETKESQEAGLDQSEDQIAPREEWVKLPSKEDRTFDTLFTGSSINISAMTGSPQQPSALFVDLMQRTLSLDPAKRVSAAEALRHPFFDAKL
jgi:serine/threonine protein kinase